MPIWVHSEVVTGWVALVSAHVLLLVPAMVRHAVLFCVTSFQPFHVWLANHGCCATARLLPATKFAHVVEAGLLLVRILSRLVIVATLTAVMIVVSLSAVIGIASGTTALMFLQLMV